MARVFGGLRRHARKVIRVRWPAFTVLKGVVRYEPVAGTLPSLVLDMNRKGVSIGINR
jgi:hypothetical protein